MKNMKEKLKIILYYIIIIVVAAILCIPLLNKNADIYFDDGIQHISRAYSTKLSIDNGESTKVLFNLTNGYGYSWDLFYGPLSTMGLLIINWIMSSWINAYKLLLFICLFLSGFSMFKFVFRITEDRNVAGLASVLYMSMPYHLTDMYIRNALGEYISFIFVPLVFLGLYNIFHKDNKDYWLILGAVGLILTHNLMTILTVIFAFIYLIIYLPVLKDKEIRNKIIFNLVFILFLTAFFWLPMLESTIYTNYKAYEPEGMTTQKRLLSYALETKELFVTEKDKTYVFEIGPHIWIMLCFAIPVLKVLDKQYKKEYILFFFLSLFCMFASTKYFPWKYLDDSFYIIQFPWRLLAFANMFLAVVCSINMGIIIKKYGFKDFIILSVITIIYIASLKDFVPTTEIVKNVKDFNVGVISGREEENVVGIAKGEYLPSLADDSRFYIAARENTVLVIDGNGEVTNVKKNGAHLTCEITTLENNTVYEFPYIYYPGYTITIDGHKIGYFESENGLVAIGLNKSVKYDVEIEFTETTLTKMSNVFSIISLIAYIVCLYVSFKPEKEDGNIEVKEEN